MDLSVILLTWALLISAVVGLLTGVFGVGGGFLLTPALMILLRVPPSMAVGMGLIIVLLTSSVGLFKRRGTGTVDVRLAAVLSCGCMIGAALGQRLLEYAKHLPPVRIAGRPQGVLEYGLLWAFLLLLTWIAALLYSDYRRSILRAHQAPRGLFASLRCGPRMSFASVPAVALPVAALLLLGFVIGLPTGSMGIGGGMLWMPALFYLVGQGGQAAAGTSLLIVWLSVLLASLLNVSNGNICWPLCATMLAGGMTGSWYGSQIGLRMAGARLRFYFIYVLLAAILLVGYKLVVLTWL